MGTHSWEQMEGSEAGGCPSPPLQLGGVPRGEQGGIYSPGVQPQPRPRAQRLGGPGRGGRGEAQGVGPAPLLLSWLGLGSPHCPAATGGGRGEVRHHQGPPDLRHLIMPSPAPLLSPNASPQPPQPSTIPEGLACVAQHPTRPPNIPQGLPTPPPLSQCPSPAPSNPSANPVPLPLSLLSHNAASGIPSPPLLHDTPIPCSPSPCYSIISSLVPPQSHNAPPQAPPIPLLSQCLYHPPSLPLHYPTMPQALCYPTMLLPSPDPSTIPQCFYPPRSLHYPTMPHS